MNFVDIVVLAVIALSTLLALGRGFVKEVLSIFGWIGAAIGTFLIFFYVPQVREFARKQIAEPLLADIACAVGLFVVLLIVLGFFNHAISSRVHGSSLGPLDKSLGAGVRAAARRGAGGARPHGDDRLVHAEQGAAARCHQPGAHRAVRGDGGEFHQGAHSPGMEGPRQRRVQRGREGRRAGQGAQQNPREAEPSVPQPTTPACRRIAGRLEPEWRAGNATQPCWKSRWTRGTIRV
ncbi:MAG: CvpA family protein [Sphingomonadales bacterium]|nr:CvpA family protein [Sphingomonadales bacterium]